MALLHTDSVAGPVGYNHLSGTSISGFSGVLVNSFYTALWRRGEECGGGEPLLVVFANGCGVNTPMMADFNLSVKCHRMRSGKGICTTGSWEPV